MLTIKYIPKSSMLGMSSDDKVKTIIGHTKNNKIILLEGKLKSNEEAALIRETMYGISKDLRFNGIEMAVFQNRTSLDILNNMRESLAKWLVGERDGLDGLTIIGPASIIKELKQSPEQLEMHFSREFLELKLKKNRDT